MHRRFRLAMPQLLSPTRLLRKAPQSSQTIQSALSTLIFRKRSSLPQPRFWIVRGLPTMRRPECAGSERHFYVCFRQPFVDVVSVDVISYLKLSGSRLSSRPSVVSACGYRRKANVADAAAARFRIPKGVVNNPLVDCTRALNIRLRALRDFARRRFHDTVGRQELGRPQKVLQFLAVPFSCLPGRGEIDRIVFGRDSACEVEDRPYDGWKFCGDDSERVALAFDHLGGSALAADGIREGLLEGRFTNECRRHPYARLPGGFQDFDAGRHLKCAPTVKRCDL